MGTGASGDGERVVHASDGAEPWINVMRTSSSGLQVTCQSMASGEVLDGEILQFPATQATSVAPHGSVVMRPPQAGGVWVDDRVVLAAPSGVRGSGSGAVRRWSRDDR